MAGADRSDADRDRDPQSGDQCARRDAVGRRPDDRDAQPARGYRRGGITRRASRASELAGRDCIGLSVRDTGTGMSEEVLRSAVEPFFTTKEPGKGSGLGLSQVYGTVQQSNGAMHIESRVGVGTAVHLFLPRALVDAAAAGTGARIGRRRDGRRARSGRRRRSRRARHHRADAAAMRLHGRRGGERTGGARRARRMAAWRRESEPCALVVIDIAMPGLSGVETIARARRQWPDLRVLYMTGYADAAGREPGYRRRQAAQKAVSLPERRAVRDRRRPHARAKDRAAEAADIAASAAMRRASPLGQTAQDQTAQDQNARDQTAIGG